MEFMFPFHPSNSHFWVRTLKYALHALHVGNSRSYGEEERNTGRNPVHHRIRPETALAAEPNLQYHLYIIT